MTRRQGLWMALVGLIIAVLCTIPASPTPQAEGGGVSPLLMLMAQVVGGIIAGVGLVMSLNKQLAGLNQQPPETSEKKQLT
jgi:hypothetical protein